MRKSFKLSDLNYKFPNQFQQIYDYLKKLKYKDTPDYDYIQNLFESGMKEDSVLPDSFNWSDFLSKYEILTKYQEALCNLTLKVLNDRDKKENQRINDQNAKNSENLKKRKQKELFNRIKIVYINYYHLFYKII